MFVNNFGKCGPILKIISPIDRKFVYAYSTKISTSLQYVATLPCESRKSKNGTDFDDPETVDMFLRSLWALDSIFNYS